MTGSGTKDDPWQLKTAPGTSEYQMWRDLSADPPALVCQVGSTQLKYHLRSIEDLHTMLKDHGDWMDLGAADEQKDAKPGTVEGWGRDPENPVGGWYGLRKGYRGRFGMYLPPLLEALGQGRADPRRQEQPGAGDLTRDPGGPPTIRTSGSARSASALPETFGAVEPRRGELVRREAPVRHVGRSTPRRSTSGLACRAGGRPGDAGRGRP